jgi:hypothetical protein
MGMEDQILFHRKQNPVWLVGRILLHLNAQQVTYGSKGQVEWSSRLYIHQLHSDKDQQQNRLSR